MKKLLLLGTSRLHRPFSKRINNKCITNFQDNIELVFPGLGYFHSAAELLQIIRFIKHPDSLPLCMRPYIFRVENRSSTPLNEFKCEFESAIRLNSFYRPSVNVSDINYLMLEVSTLSVNIHTETGVVLHSNPNIFKDVSYADIWPDGYYKKYEPDMPVTKFETSLELLTEQLSAICAELPQAVVMVMGHLRSENHPHAFRDKVNSTLKIACQYSGCEYFDTAEFLDRYGFAMSNGVRDIHHLSYDGEYALGQAIQTKFKNLSLI